MKLVVVYGLKTNDYRFLEQFYPARRLSEECANRSIPLRFLFPPDVPSFLEKTVSLREKSETVCLIRGKAASGTVQLLEREGYRCVNSSASLALAGDKLETAVFLEKNGWPTPLTFTARDFQKNDGPQPLSFPLVAKPRLGSRGEGVCLLTGPEQLPGLPEDTLLQQYIASSHGRDLRFFFAGNTILALAARQSLSLSFLSNTSTGGCMTVPPYTPEVTEYWKKMTLDIARASGLWYGTVDFLYLNVREEIPADRSLELTVCELNGSPGFESLEKDCLCDIAGALLDRLLESF